MPAVSFTWMSTIIRPVSVVLLIMSASPLHSSGPPWIGCAGAAGNTQVPIVAGTNSSFGEGPLEPPLVLGLVEDDSTTPDVISPDVSASVLASTVVDWSVPPAPVERLVPWSTCEVVLASPPPSAVGSNAGFRTRQALARETGAIMSEGRTARRSPIDCRMSSRAARA